MFKVTDPGVNYLKISSQHGIEKKSFSNVWREGDEKREREREKDAKGKAVKRCSICLPSQDLFKHQLSPVRFVLQCDYSV